jgi:hypothetical protein
LNASPLPLQWAVKNLKDRIDGDGFYTDFLVFIPFLVLFMIFFLNGRDIQTNHMAAGSNKRLYMYKEFPNVDEAVALLNAQGTTSNPSCQLIGTSKALRTHGTSTIGSSPSSFPAHGTARRRATAARPSSDEAKCSTSAR